MRKLFTAPSMRESAIKIKDNLIRKATCRVRDFIETNVLPGYNVRFHHDSQSNVPSTHTTLPSSPLFSLHDAGTTLTSEKPTLAQDSIENIVTANKGKHICLLVHGFSSGPDELKYVAESIEKSSDGHTKCVLLCMGGHGKDYNSFKYSSYKDWMNPIEQTVTDLTTLGFKISLLSVSGGATATAYLYISGRLNSVERLVFLDSFIDFTPTFYFTPILYQLIESIESKKTPQPYKQSRLPASALWNLYKMATMLREACYNHLTSQPRPKISDADILVIASKHDPIAPSSGSKLLYSTFNLAMGEQVKWLELPSDKHVILDETGKEFNASDKQCMMIAMEKTTQFLHSSYPK